MSRLLSLKSTFEPLVISTYIISLISKCFKEAVKIMYVSDVYNMYLANSRIKSTPQMTESS